MSSRVPVGMGGAVGEERHEGSRPAGTCENLPGYALYHPALARGQTPAASANETAQK
ncbi:hypothetical protein [Hymenobacter canadensis]|uniref:Uncharacterized protein n=1 Tax=Hymenobacter canadensis TaxID=2999067 RepID=A0ABY7LN22_9BACT|nr:hypothetical protein [Hymenobacter canadensis]WBA41219.1 hypothetical protein O3303_15510 [Hymenobacter canadensis]